MNLENKKQEEFYKFCYNLCVESNWDPNQLWYYASKFSIGASIIKENARLYMKNYLALDADKIAAKKDFFLPYKYKQMLTKYQGIIAILIKDNIITENDINTIDWIIENLKTHISKYCYEVCINNKWEKKIIIQIAKDLGISYELLYKNAKEYFEHHLKLPYDNLKSYIEPFKKGNKHSKYSNIFNKIIILEGEELTQFLENCNCQISTIRSCVHDFVIVNYPNNYEEMKQLITQKINNYTQNKAAIKKEDKKKKKLEIARIIINTFLEKNLSIKNFCITYNIKNDRLNKILSLIKDNDPILYQKYIDKVEKEEINNYNKSVKLLNKVIEMIKSNKDFTILDYYFMTVFDFKELITISHKELELEDLKLFKLFISKNKITRPFNNEDIKNILNSKTIIGGKIDANNNIVANSGREITKEEKMAVINFLKENNIPLYPKVYSIALNRYINKQLDIKIKKKVKNS